MDSNPHFWQCSQLRQPSPPPPFVDSFNMHQLLGSLPNTMPPCEGSTPMPTIYERGRQQSFSGPTRSQQRRRCKTDARSPDNFLHISYGTITSDCSTGTQPVYARMGALGDTGPGEARPPSRNPQTVNHESIYQRRLKPYCRHRGDQERYNISYHRRHSGLSQTQRQGRGKEDPSVYKIPGIDFQSMLVSQSIHHPLFTTLSSRCDSK
ncbi:hypothetical protein BYT27DRAFT_7184083 [Phlegmacium glaucopus]|nr:hypothetical protein BYT27DRAFT_7184083 [Phlegmacium glaucopus]